MTSLKDYLDSIRQSLDRIEAAGNVDDKPRFEMAWRQMDSMANSLAVVHEACDAERDPAAEQLDRELRPPQAIR